MAGQGKYTDYIPTNTDSAARWKFMQKLYKGTSGDSTPGGSASDQTPPFVEFTDPLKAAAAASLAGNKFLRASDSKGVQIGDAGYFPGGVDLEFRGATSVVSVPNIAAGANDSWHQPGDPANSYVPDITSPGPGFTDGVDKKQDPKITSTDIKPNIVPGKDNNTKNPSDAGTALFDANALGSSLTLGKSGV